MGDLAVNLLVGGLTGLLCLAVFSPDWPGWLAMLAGMPLGMGLAFVVASGASIVLGAFELMVPSMLTGMIAGMICAMGASATALPWVEALRLGAACGVFAFGFTTAAHLVLRGEDPRWTS